jgi:hypothetical protein
MYRDIEKDALNAGDEQEKIFEDDEMWKVFDEKR